MKPQLNTKWLTIAAAGWLAFGCASHRDRAAQPAAAEPSSDPSSQVKMYSADQPQRSVLPELGKGDAPSLVQPFNDCDATVCIGSAPAALVDAIRSRAAQAQTCYERSLAKAPTLAGRVVLSLRVTHDGTACPFGVDQNDLADSKEFLPCLRTLLSASYPRPHSGCVDIRLPLRFVPEYIEGDAGAGTNGGV